ncbi:Two-component response regulator ORR23 [Bienertia sinuspersici]
MSPVSATDICVLLVDSDSACLQKTLTQLLDAGYRVVTISRGDEALSVLKHKKRKVDLVLTRTKLPDMCAFELAEIIDTQFRLAVVMVSDFYDERTFLRGLLTGARFCYCFPVHENGVQNLWQHTVKKRFIREETGLDFFESSATGASSQNRIRNFNNLELPFSFNWTHDLHCKFLEVVVELGVDTATPLEILLRIAVPELTVEIVAKKLQQYRSYLKRQQEVYWNIQSSSNEVQAKLMSFLGATRPLPYSVPDSLLIRSGLMPLADTAPSSSTAAEDPLVIALPAPAQEEDETETDD